MAPYFASAFGVFLMRQTFRAIPRDFEDAAMIDGFNPTITFQRTQTIMGGAVHCDFRYRSVEPPA